MGGVKSAACEEDGMGKYLVTQKYCYASLYVVSGADSVGARKCSNGEMAKLGDSE